MRKDITFTELAVIAEIGNPKNPIIVRVVRASNDTLAVDARRSFTNQDGETIATRKGIYIPIDLAEQVAEAILTGARHFRADPPRR